MPTRRDVCVGVGFSVAKPFIFFEAFRPRTKGARSCLVPRVRAVSLSHRHHSSLISHPLATTRKQAHEIHGRKPQPRRCTSTKRPSCPCLGTAAALATAYALSLRVLPRTSGPKARVLFIWHLFDALIHFIFEGSFLWNCFFVHAPHPSGNRRGSAFLPPDVHFLGRRDRTYGAAHGSGRVFAALAASTRARTAAGRAPTLPLSASRSSPCASAGPLALWCAEMVRRAEREREHAVGRKNVVGTVNRKWFWMVVLATGELYGG
jgi:hypothetical protein